MNLIIEYTDGSIQRINSDEKWRLTAQGPIRSNNEYDGEIYDARMELGNWTQPGYDDSKLAESATCFIAVRYTSWQYRSQHESDEKR